MYVIGIVNRFSAGLKKKAEFSKLYIHNGDACNTVAAVTLNFCKRKCRW